MNSVNHFAVWLSRIIFKTSNGEIKVLYRKLEKTALKIVKNESHRKFNECCLINDLLPTYTNIKTHDEAAKTETFVLDFRKKIIEREIGELRSDALVLKTEYNESVAALETKLDSNIRAKAFKLFLERVTNAKNLSLHIIHDRKLATLYGGPILQK